MITQRPDIVVENDIGRVLLVVEIKNRAVWTRERAEEYHRELLDSGAFQNSRFFLLASQDVGFLWKQDEGTGVAALVSEFEMTGILQNYVDEADLSSRMRGTQLEIPLLMWLSDLGRGNVNSVKTNAALLDLANTIRDAKLRVEPSL